MHPRLAELSAYLDEQRAALAAAVGEVPSSLQAAQPPSGGWSVAEVLEHLVLVERRIAGAFRVWLEEARAGGLTPETDESPVLATVNVAALLDRSNKRSATPSVTPTGTMSADDASRELDTIRAEMKAVIAGVDGLALAAIVKPHPVLGQANMYQWMAFTAAHMGRHAAQIRAAGVELQAAQGA